jgi:hypothetical protein
MTTRRTPLTDELDLTTCTWLKRKDVFVARELFPYEGDRLVIQRFLAGGKRRKHKLTDDLAQPSSDRMSMENGKLYLDRGMIAWVDTGGSLVFQLSGPYPMAVSRVVQHVNELLGIEDGEISYQRDTAMMSHTLGEWSYFHGDRPISLREPFVVAGPLSLQAYRASLRSEG